MFYMKYQKTNVKAIKAFSVLKGTYAVQAIDKVEYESFLS